MILQILILGVGLNLTKIFYGWVHSLLKSSTFVLDVFLLSVQSSEDNVTCNAKPTLVSKPFYRLDLFNRKMRDVLFTAVLVTTIGNHTLGHFGTSDGRILQVAICLRI